MTTAASIRRVLAEGPATPREIGAALSLDSRRVVWHLSDQRRRDYVRVTNRIYALTPRGRWKVRRDGR